MQNTRPTSEKNDGRLIGGQVFYVERDRIYAYLQVCKEVRRNPLTILDALEMNYCALGYKRESGNGYIKVGATLDDANNPKIEVNAWVARGTSNVRLKGPKKHGTIIERRQILKLEAKLVQQTAQTQPSQPSQ